MKQIVRADNWEALREFTDARIALGRTGTSIPLKHELAFKLAHAHARDAIHSIMDIDALLTGLRLFDLPMLVLSSQATNRAEYLKRPDLGRLPAEASMTTVAEFASPGDLAIVIADGLSATAINRNVIPLLSILIPKLKAAGCSLCPLSLVQQGRVAIGDPIAAGLEAKQVLVLIGERPGLSSPDSVGAYLTYQPKPGLTDESRNCVSNIRPQGLSFERAAETIFFLITESLRRKISGTQLKNQTGAIKNEPGAVSGNSPA